MAIAAGPRECAELRTCGKPSGRLRLSPAGHPGHRMRDTTGRPALSAWNRRPRRREAADMSAMTNSDWRKVSGLVHAFHEADRDVPGPVLAELGATVGCDVAS